MFDIALIASECTGSVSDSVRLLSELQVFRGSILQVLPVLAVIRKGTAGIGNTLGSCTAATLLLNRIITQAGLSLAVSSLRLSYCECPQHERKNQSFEYTPSVTYPEMSMCAHCCVPASECYEFDTKKNGSSASCIPRERPGRSFPDCLHCKV